MLVARPYEDLERFRAAATALLAALPGTASSMPCARTARAVNRVRDAYEPGFRGMLALAYPPFSAG
jgi:hypothetical protein